MPHSHHSSRWERELVRRLEEWVAAAAVNSRDWDLQSECGDCAVDPLLDAINQVRPWPHWMRHSLRTHFTEMRRDELEMNTTSSNPDDSIVLLDMWLNDNVQKVWRWEDQIFPLLFPKRKHAHSLRGIVDHWIDGLDFWCATDAETSTSDCELCTGFVLVEAAGLPDWTPHSLTHELAVALVAYLGTHLGYDWKAGIGPVIDPRGAPEWLQESIEESRQAATIEWEESAFVSLRRLAPRLTEALDLIVLPKIEARTNG